MRAVAIFVTTGLDPVVHTDLPLCMDCRIKSGNDDIAATKESSECVEFNRNPARQTVLILRQKSKRF
jgi:hypothetical protein